MNRSAIYCIPRSRVAGGGPTIVRRLRLIGLLLAAFGGIAMAAPAPLAAAESPKTIPAALQQFVDNHTLAGAVTLVASSNQVLSLEAVGYMDIARKRPMRTDALFWIASQSKPMTAAALMMLVDEASRVKPLMRGPAAPPNDPVISSCMVPPLTVKGPVA